MDIDMPDHGWACPRIPWACPTTIEHLEQNRTEQKESSRQAMKMGQERGFGTGKDAQPATGKELATFPFANRPVHNLFTTCQHLFTTKSDQMIPSVPPCCETRETPFRNTEHQSRPPLPPAYTFFASLHTFCVAITQRLGYAGFKRWG